MQSHALTAESPCVWVENRRRDFNGTQIRHSHSVSFEYHYRGEMRGNFSVLVTRLRPLVITKRTIDAWFSSQSAKGTSLTDQ